LQHSYAYAQIVDSLMSSSGNCEKGTAEKWIYFFMYYQLRV
jgi:hypothetical protein